jgi:outer membrane protein OmpA-like peptidoglycan-associated protein
MKIASRRHGSVLRALCALAPVAALLVAPEAHAQSALSRFSLRLEAGGGLMLTDVQRGLLGYDTAHVQATGRVGFELADMLVLQASVNGGFFFARQGLDLGQTLAFQGGLRFQPMVGARGRLWLDANPGLYLTGAEQRFGFDAGLGYEFDASPAISLGPMLRYHYVMADPMVNLPESAQYATLGLTVTARVPRTHPLPPLAIVDQDQDGVADLEDACPTVPMGANPDAARRGCPRSDRDGDGVFDDEDQCADVAMGANPDATRRGCPRPDTDGDGVFDDQDQCVNQARGEHPDPERAGCPDGDADGDGVLDHADQCRTVAQGLRPDPERAGCPLPDRDGDMVPDVPDHCPDVPGAPNPDPNLNGCPGLVRVDSARIRITNPVYFATNRDVILPRSFPVLTAVGDALRAVPEIRRVSIEGHTDDVGDDAANMDLSNRRAQSVLRWLTEHGVAASRLEARGFGETRPLRAIAGLRGRQLSAARAENRRVDFNITDPAPGAQPAASQPAASQPAANKR